MTGALGRIILRYGAGGIFGAAVGNSLASDNDLVLVVGTAAGSIIAAGVECAYVVAKQKGWTL